MKIPFYKQLGAIVKPSAIFGSNTSSLKIADFARPSGRPEKFVSAAAPLLSVSVYVHPKSHPPHASFRPPPTYSIDHID